MAEDILWFETLKRGDVARVGGKNSSLGEMVQSLGGQGIAVPPGFATTAEAFRRYLAHNGLDAGIAEQLALLEQGRQTLQETGASIRKSIVAGEWPEEMRASILQAYTELGARSGGGVASAAGGRCV